MGLGGDRQSEIKTCSPHHRSPNPIYPHLTVFLALTLQASSVYSAAAQNRVVPTVLQRL